MTFLNLYEGYLLRRVTMNYKCFADKNAFIVGGSEGIGLETAKLLASTGTNVFIFSRNETKLKKAIDEIKTNSVSTSQKFSFLPLDVGDNNHVIPIMKKAAEDFGGVDILINSAGKATPHYFEDIDYNQFDETMKTNLYGIRNTVAALLPYLKKKGGMIVNIASIAGFIGVFGYTDYAASKFGVIGFSEALKSELKQYNIDVCVLCPPDTHTPGYEKEMTTKPAETRAISGTAKIRTARYVAEALVKGMKKKKFLIIPGFDSKLTYLVKHVTPAAADFFMDAKIKKAQKGKYYAHEK